MPISSGDRELLLNKRPPLGEYEVSTLCLTARILRTECGDEDTIRVRQEWVRKLLLCTAGSGFFAVSVVVDSCLELPFLLSLGLVVAETVYREIVLRKTRINIAEPARLRRATRCTNNQHDGRFIALGPKTYGCRPWEWRRESRPSPQ